MASSDAALRYLLAEFLLHWFYLVKTLQAPRRPSATPRHTATHHVKLQRELLAIYITKVGCCCTCMLLQVVACNKRVIAAFQLIPIAIVVVVVAILLVFLLLLARR